MSETVSLTIDGKAVSVAAGTNLIEAAETAGIHIPNLCYLKGMRGIGACRLCLVEVEGMKAPVVACITRAKEGMNVNTATEHIQEMRKFIIDLILSMHPLDCMTCTKAGVCNLQQYAYDFEVKESSLTRKKFGYPVDEANPFIKRDPDYCILCARCVRVCKEQGTNVLEFMGRGVGAKVVTAMDRPLQESDCTFCGSCVDACPVNALLEADRWRKGREWEYSKTKSVCLSCGNGCDIDVSSGESGVIRINAGADEGSVEHYICATGRFGFDALSSDARVLSPLKKVNGKHEEISWKEALTEVAEKLKAAKGKVGIISTAGILNQDAFVLSKLASDVIKTKNIDTTASLYSEPSAMKFSDTVDVDSADVIISVGLNLSQWERVLPALDAAMRKRAARGAKLVVISEKETRLSDLGAVSIQSDEASALAEIAKGLIDKGNSADKELASAVSGITVSEAGEKAATLLAEAKSPVIFCPPSLFNAARNLSLLSKARVVAVPLEANARGVTAMGLTTEGKGYAELVKGGVDTLYVVGEVPLKKRPNVKFLVVQTSYITDLAKEADIILPAATYLESQGTITNYLGKIKELHRIIEPAGESRQHKDIFIKLSKIMDKPLKESAAEMKSAFEISSKPRFHPFEKKKGLDPDVADFTVSMSTCVIDHSRLLWLRESKAAV